MSATDGQDKGAIDTQSIASTFNKMQDSLAEKIRLGTVKPDDIRVYYTLLFAMGEKEMFSPAHIFERAKDVHDLTVQKQIRMTGSEPNMESVEVAQLAWSTLWSTASVFASSINVMLHQSPEPTAQQKLISTLSDALANRMRWNLGGDEAVRQAEDYIGSFEAIYDIMSQKCLATGDRLGAYILGIDFMKAMARQGGIALEKVRDIALLSSSKKTKPDKKADDLVDALYSLQTSIVCAAVNCAENTAEIFRASGSVQSYAAKDQFPIELINLSLSMTIRDTHTRDSMPVAADLSRRILGIATEVIDLMYTKLGKIKFFQEFPGGDPLKRSDFGVLLRDPMAGDAARAFLDKFEIASIGFEIASGEVASMLHVSIEPRPAPQAPAALAAGRVRASKRGKGEPQPGGDGAA